MKIQPLNQSEFPLIIIKDLGTMFISEKSKTRKRFALFTCPVCNAIFKTQTANVKNGRTTKCMSCRNKDISNNKKIHGETGTRLYNVWKGMKRRCYNKNDQHYRYYGAKGVIVCNEWQDYTKFKLWSLANGYKEQIKNGKNTLSIDRIDSNKSYFPENCRWTTVEVQARNVSSYINTFKCVDKRDNGRFRTKITINKQQITIGTFDTALEAAIAYNNYVIEHKLEHALNKTEKEINDN